MVLCSCLGYELFNMHVKYSFSCSLRWDGTACVKGHRYFPFCWLCPEWGTDWEEKAPQCFEERRPVLQQRRPDENRQRQLHLLPGSCRWHIQVHYWREGLARQTSHHCPSISAWKNANIMLNVGYMKGTSFKDYRMLYLHVSLQVNYFTSISAVVKHKSPDFYCFLCPLVLTGGKARTWRRLKCRTSWRWAVVSKRPTFTVSECQVLPLILRNK